MKSAELISKSEYAKHRGCAPSAVTKAIQEGRISTFDGKINPRLADLEWAENSRARADSRKTLAAPATAPDAPRAGADAAPQTEPGYADHRRAREAAEAERAQLEVAKLAGRLVERDSTERAIFDAFRALRDAAFSAPQRAATRVIGLAETRDIEQVFTAELRKAFDGWEERMLERLPAREGA